MPSELTVTAVNRGGMRVDVTDGDHTLTMDYPLPGTDGEMAGPTPLRVLLASLGACSANTMALLLRKQRQPVRTVEVEARGTRRDEHPTVITAIELAFTVHGRGVDPEAVRRALGIAEAELCPVWAMLKPGTPISSTFAVVDD